DLLGMYIVENESAAAWSQIFTDLKSRGLEDALFVCSDNLTGLQKAIEATLPASVHQICIVHQIRNTLKFVSYKDRKLVMAEIKAIYQADNLERAQEALEQFKKKWASKYSAAVNSW